MEFPLVCSYGLPALFPVAASKCLVHCWSCCMLHLPDLKKCDVLMCCVACVVQNKRWSRLDCNELATKLGSQVNTIVCLQFSSSIQTRIDDLI